MNTKIAVQVSQHCLYLGHRMTVVAKKDYECLNLNQSKHQGATHEYLQGIAYIKFI